VSYATTTLLPPGLSQAFGRSRRSTRLLLGEGKMLVKRQEHGDQGDADPGADVILGPDRLVPVESDVFCGRRFHGRI